MKRIYHYSGFTLIEIAAVLVIIAILSTLAVKHMGSSGISVYGDADRLVADLRYAQSLAMSRGQTVTVEVTVSCDSGESCWYLEGEEGELPFADGETERTVHDPKVSIATDTTVEFQYPDGTVDSDQTITLQRGSHRIYVKVYGVTGYVEIQ